MSRATTIAVCYPQVPFSSGGCELAVQSLCRELDRRGFESTSVSVPFRWTPREEVGRSCLAWRLIDLSEANGRRIDRVIATKFPSYAVQHPNKVTWLFHQFRQVYDLYGTEWSDYAPGDEAWRDLVQRIDERTLAESRAVYSLSENVSDRLRRYNGLESTPLHHPPPRHDEFRAGSNEPYVLSVGRLDAMKRLAPLLHALAKTDGALACVIVGRGPNEGALRSLAASLGLETRVRFAGAANFEELIELYANCRAVYFAPYDEDYGFVTLEAFLSGKPVVTALDAGGPLEFVRDRENGRIVDLAGPELGEALQELLERPDWAAELGARGQTRASSIGWDPVVDALTDGAETP